MPAEQNIDEKVDVKIDKKIGEARLPDSVSLDTAENVASKTTAEQDLKSAGQRLINLTWEDTQKKIALYAVYLTMLISGAVVISGMFIPEIDKTLTVAAFTFLSSTTSLIVGFYFSRTNHARIGDEQSRNQLDDRR